MPFQGIKYPVKSNVREVTMVPLGIQGNAGPGATVVLPFRDTTINRTAPGVYELEIAEGPYFAVDPLVMQSQNSGGPYFVESGYDQGTNILTLQVYDPTGAPADITPGDDFQMFLILTVARPEFVSPP